MSAWDERLRKIENARESQAEELRQKREAEDRARQERAAALWSRILDVTQWALARYKAAGVGPLPIYAAWDAEVKPRFKKPYRETQRRQIGSGYPLFRFNSTIEHENYHEEYHHIVLVTSQMRVLTVVSKTSGPYSSSYPAITEVEIRSKNPVGDPAAFLSSLVTTDAQSISPDYAKDIEQVCDFIVEYVGRRTQPGQSVQF